MTVPYAGEVDRWLSTNPRRGTRSAWISGANGTIRTLVREGGSLTVVDHVAGAAMPAEVARFAIPWPEDRFLGFAVSTDLGYAVFAGAASMHAVNADGQQRWTYRYPGSPADTARASLMISEEGRRVWAWVPSDVTVDGFDHWLVLDGRDATVVAQTPIESVGVGAEHFRHPDGIHVGLSIGEGQDGAVLMWGRLSNGRLEHWRGDDDLVLADLSPTGEYYLTVAHDQTQAQLHAFPTGSPVWSAPGDLIPRAPHEHHEDLFWDYYAGFVDNAAVILSDVEYDETEHAGHFLVDATTGRGLGEISYPTPVTGYPRPLGDGTWLTASEEAITRWTLR